MSGICRLKDGEFYYIQELETIDESFCNALGAVVSIAASDTKIITFAPQGLAKDITIGQTYGKINKVNDKMG